MTENPRRPTEAELHEWFDRYSNWDRWGRDDQLGTLNFITPEKHVQAAQLVVLGEQVSCAWDLAMNSSVVTNQLPSQRHMLRTGLGYTRGPQDTTTPSGARSTDGSMGVAIEGISLQFHGRAITHLDALSHVFYQGQMYGGVPSEYVTDHDGAQVHDVRSASAGIHTRGVLLDVARAQGRTQLDPGEGIFPEDLERAEEVQGVRVESGDALFVRTGDGARRISGDWDPVAHGSPGLHAACIPWLYDRSVAALGVDGPQEVTPTGYPGFALPLHAVGIVAMGLWLIDNCQLEDLTQTCERLDRWTFFLTATPLRMTGVTGSPINPVAVF